MQAAAPTTQTLPAGIDQPLSQMRKAIARSTMQSKAPVPHFYLTVEIDMAQAEQVRGQFKQNRQTHPSITDLLIKASALALPGILRSMCPLPEMPSDGIHQSISA